MNDDFSGPPGMDNFDGIKIEQPQAGPQSHDGSRGQEISSFQGLFFLE